jgi:lipid-binding SYLF domain-containing protein
MRVRVAASVAALALVFLSAARAPAQRSEARKVEEAVDVLAGISAVPEKQVPAYLMKSVKAVAVFPRVQKAGLVIGGQYGKGVVVARSREGKWGSPLFLTLTGGSVGWQIGIQSIDLVLFFRTEASVEGVLREGFTLGVDAAVAAGAAGRQAGAITDTAMTAEVYSYSRSRGLFAGVSVSGSTLEPDDDANAAYYGRDVRARDILSGEAQSSSPSAADLRRALEALARAVER